MFYEYVIHNDFYVHLHNMYVYIYPNNTYIHISQLADLILSLILAELAFFDSFQCIKAFLQ